MFDKNMVKDKEGPPQFSLISVSVAKYSGPDPRCFSANRVRWRHKVLRKFRAAVNGFQRSVSDNQAMVLLNIGLLKEVCIPSINIRPEKTNKKFAKSLSDDRSSGPNGDVDDIEGY